MTDTKQCVCPACGAVNRIPDSRLHDNPKCGKCKEPIFTRKPLELRDHNFAKFIAKSDLPCLGLPASIVSPSGRRSFTIHLSGIISFF